jgi:hypothetical protein
MNFDSFGARMTGALRLREETYEEVEHDAGAIGQALIVVLMSSLATGVGSAGQYGADTFLPGVLVALVGWVVWAALVYVIGAKLLREPQTEADLGQLMRTTGFASAPGVFGVVRLVPFVGQWLMLTVSIWMLMAMLVAVRQALDFTSTWRALGVVSVGWLAYLLIIYIVASSLASS